MAADARATASSKPPRYEIYVRGPLAPTIMQAQTLAMSRDRHDTLLTGSLPDQSAL